MNVITYVRMTQDDDGEDGGKGLSGVVERAPGYFNPFLDILEGRE